MSSTPTPSEQLVAVEMAVAHLQHNYDQLHELLLAIQGELRGLHRRIDELSEQQELMQQPAETRTPESERPPHY